jgi:hypothetical protein
LITKTLELHSNSVKDYNDAVPFVTKIKHRSGKLLLIKKVYELRYRCSSSKSYSILKKMERLIDNMLAS